MPDEKKKPTLSKVIETLARRESQLRGKIKEVKALQTENAELARRPTAEALQAENKALKDTARKGAYAQAWDAAARKAGIAPELIGDAFTLAQLDQTAEAPDATAIDAAAVEFLKGRPLFKAGDAAPQPRPLERGPGGERGTGPGSLTGKFPYKTADLGNAEWTAVNSGKLAEAFANGTAVCVD